MEKKISVGDTQQVRALVGSIQDPDIERKPSDPLQELLDTVTNAIIYATSMNEKPEIRVPRIASTGKTQSDVEMWSSEEVFYLPGKIKLSQVRRMQELVRAPNGRRLFYRFMVRGHWRRPAKNWKIQRPRWIEPHWKGPDMAAVIERAYELKSE
jgi:hypothetical protein